jgi:hypothetical protein
MNPQKWNKYAYVLNNPLSLVDPNGEEEMWIQYRAFIPPAQVGVGAASGRGDNRTFSSQENASSRVSLTMHVETDPAKNGGNPLLGVTTGINTTHNNLTRSRHSCCCGSSSHGHRNSGCQWERESERANECA